MSQAHGLVPSKSLSRKSLQSESYVNGKVVSPDDLVLNRLKAHLGVFARAKQSGVVSPDYSVFRLKCDASVIYCEALFKTPTYIAQFRRRTKGIVEGFWRLYTDDFYNVPALLPPRSEQDQIVAYLRVKDFHVARLIKVKRGLIELLNEQKRNIIVHAVTRGLASSAKLKPSGVKWLGNVPDSWEIVHFGSTVKIVNGFPFDSARFTSTVGHPLVRIRDLNSTETVVRYDGPEVAAAVIDSGDLLVGMDGDFNAAQWRGGRALLNQRMCCVRPKTRLSTAYLAFLMPLALKYINELTLSTTVKHLSSVDLKRLRFPVPDISEQNGIVETIKVKIAPIDRAIEQATDEIRLIREYRDRVISDVVTGQVDVRGWTPGPDDEIAEEDLVALTGTDEDDGIPDDAEAPDK